MLWWLMTIGLIWLISDPEKSLAEDIEILIDAYDQVEGILEAEGESGYQVENLLDGLK
jgi:hypothetical protein